MENKTKIIFVSSTEPPDWEVVRGQWFPTVEKIVIVKK
jgi:hypothetical protein